MGILNLLMPLILAALQLVPSLIAAIKGAEAASPEPGTGPQKKAIVMAAVTPAGAPSELVNHISSMVDQHVAALNAAKVFTRSTPPPVPAPAAESEVVIEEHKAA